MARFDNKVVLVSGGARGQGAAEARLLVAQGAKVVIGDVLDNQGQSLAVELGPAASFVRHDVTSEADWARAVEAAQKLGGLHGLVNNAGIYQPAALMETDDALWQRHIQINQYGCFLGMKAVVPAMERSGGGSIVNISSVAGLKGSPGSSIRPLPLQFETIDHVGGDRSGARQLAERPAQQGAGRAALGGGDHGSEVPGLTNVTLDFATFTNTRHITMFPPGAGLPRRGRPLRHPAETWRGGQQQFESRHLTRHSAVSD